VSGDWPVEVTALRPVNSGAVVWQAQGRVCLTVITKATFGLVPDGVVRLVAPEKLTLTERHRDDNPARSLMVGGEIDPYKPRVDVLFSGHAHAPAGRLESAIAVRLGIYGESTGLEKTLHVIGDRQPGAIDRPQPFQKMPIEWERAVKGGGVDENPVGVPSIAASHLPNIIDPARPERPAGYGPIARSWPSRLQYLCGGAAPRDTAAVLDVPDTLAWDYFQVAPGDQQMEDVRGDEQIVLDNLHGTLPRIQSQLPSARGVARVFGGDAPTDGFPIELDLDTLSVDGDRQVISIVWRGCLMLEGDTAELSCLRVVTGVEMPGFPMPWHQARPAVVPTPAPLRGADAPESTQDGEGSTLAFSPEEARRLIANAAGRAPQHGASHSKSARPSSVPPSARTGPPPAPPAAPRVSQLNLEQYVLHGDVDELSGPTSELSDGDEATHALDEPSELPLPAPAGKKGGGTRALTPEESASLLAQAPKGPPMGPPPPARVPRRDHRQSTRALTPEESAQILANAPKASPLAPPEVHALPGASQFLAQARSKASQATGHQGEHELTDEETGATLAVNPEDAARMLASPVRAIVHRSAEAPVRPRTPADGQGFDPEK